MLGYGAATTDQAWFALSPREITDLIYREIRIIDRERLTVPEADASRWPSPRNKPRRDLSFDRLTHGLTFGLPRVVQIRTEPPVAGRALSGRDESDPIRHALSRIVSARRSDAP